MSAFEKWFRNRDAAFATLDETYAEYAERAAQDAWNAALDQLEGLAEEWERLNRQSAPFADALRAHTKQLREQP